jgi:hypothetical protein
VPCFIWPFFLYPEPLRFGLESLSLLLKTIRKREAYESILFMANIGVMEPTMNFNVCMTDGIITEIQLGHMIG